MTINRALRLTAVNVGQILLNNQGLTLQNSYEILKAISNRCTQVIQFLAILEAQDGYFFNLCYF